MKANILLRMCLNKCQIATQVKVKIVDLIVWHANYCKVTRNITPPPDGLDVGIVHEHFSPTDKVNIISLGNKFQVILKDATKHTSA